MSSSAEATPTRLSKSFYVGSIIGGSVLGGIMVGMQVWFGYLLSVYSIVISLVLLYKVWAAIQDGHARTTPGKAVGYMFIPFFQLYWLFQAYWGYAKDYNSYISRHGISTSRLSEGLFLYYCILPFVYAFVYAFVYTGVIIWLAITMTNWSLTTMVFVSFMLAIVLAIPMFVIGIIILVKLCDAVNNLSAKAQC